MALFGLCIEDYADDLTAEVWSCNLEPVNLFIQLGTQWLVGPGGAYGLNYSTLYQKLDRLGVTQKRAHELEEDIRVLEDAALEEMRKN